MYALILRILRIALTQSYSTLITNSDTLLSRHYYFPELEIAARKIVTIAKEQPAKLDDYVEAEFEKIHQIEQVKAK
jgi:hypothetical protein